jgi:putative acyl-CoA dehydrogenase
MALGTTANENKPKLKLFDRYGHRLDAVELHPAYHRIMALGIHRGVAEAGTSRNMTVPGVSCETEAGVALTLRRASPSPSSRL